MAADDPFDDFRDRMIAAWPAAAVKGMEYLRGVSAPLVPVRDGDLVGSADVHMEGATAVLGYSGPYARYQHYELQLRHTHGQALYLEQPVITDGEQVVAVIADAMGDLT